MNQRNALHQPFHAIHSLDNETFLPIFWSRTIVYGLITTEVAAMTDATTNLPERHAHLWSLSIWSADSWSRADVTRFSQDNVENKDKHELYLLISFIPYCKYNLPYLVHYWTWKIRYHKWQDCIYMPHLNEISFISFKWCCWWYILQISSELFDKRLVTIFSHPFQVGFILNFLNICKFICVLKAV